MILLNHKFKSLTKLGQQHIDRSWYSHLLYGESIIVLFLVTKQETKDNSGKSLYIALRSDQGLSLPKFSSHILFNPLPWSSSLHHIPSNSMPSMSSSPMTYRLPQPVDYIPTKHTSLANFVSSHVLSFLLHFHN